jgi:hypothetical protein
VAEIGNPSYNSNTINLAQGISIPLDSLDSNKKRDLRKYPSFNALCELNDKPDLKVYARIFYFAYIVACINNLQACNLDLVREYAVAAK